MLKRDIKYLNLFTILIILTISFAVTGGDCTTTIEPGLVAPPTPPSSINLSLSGNPGGNSFALVSWGASAAENREDFFGYRITTYIVDSTGANITLINDTTKDKTIRNHTIFDVQRGTRYKSYVASVLNDGTEGRLIESKIYGGVFYNNNGVIDEFVESGPAQSGFGWDPITGNGVQYPFIEENLSVIDLHLTRSNERLMFFSPNQILSGGLVTLIDSIGAGAAGFARTDTLNIPTGVSVPVIANNVYFLQVDGNYFVKLWVKEIVQTGEPAYSSVKFEYKVQPIEGFRILKR